MHLFKKKPMSQPLGTERQDVTHEAVNGGAQNMDEATTERIERIAMNDGSIFPTAKELRIETSIRWKLISAEEVLNKILKESHNGNCEAYYFNTQFPTSVIEALKSRGYKVSKLSSDTPAYKVEW